MFDFQRDVIAASFEKPVLVDFWAPWCGPCKILGPELEKIAEEQKDNWTLVKINTEDHEDLAIQYQIRSIPNVKLFYRGEVIDEFLGALSRVMILDWLKKALPEAGMMALSRYLEEKEQPEAHELRTLLETYPSSSEIRIVLSQVILWDQPEEIADILGPIKMESPFYDKAIYLKDIASFLLMETNEEALLEIKKQLTEGHLDEAIPSIIKVLGKDNKAGEGKLTKAAIGIFNTLGMHHPLSKTYRKQLDMVLWI